MVDELGLQFGGDVFYFDEDFESFKYESKESYGLNGRENDVDDLVTELNNDYVKYEEMWKKDDMDGNNINDSEVDRSSVVEKGSGCGYGGGVCKGKGQYGEPCGSAKGS